MPELSAFLNGFGLIQGQYIGEFKIDRVFGQHKQIIRYREYEYPIEITLETKGASIEEIIHDFNHNVLTDKVINSNYGNPYRCVIPRINKNNIIVHGNNLVSIQIKGSSYRI